MKNVGTQRIETERLVLRRIDLNDVEEFYRLMIDKGVQEYLPGIPLYTGVDMAVGYIGKNLYKKYKDNTFYDWGIADKDSGKLLGRITVYKQDQERRMADLVWYIHSDFRGKGYVTEAAGAVVKFLQEVGFERIEAFANVKNISSQRVMEKCGFAYEGTLRKYDMNRDGSLYDAKMYSIIKEDKER